MNWRHVKTPFVTVVWKPSQYLQLKTSLYAVGSKQKRNKQMAKTRGQIKPENVGVNPCTAVSRKVVKARAPMPSGFMGNASYCCLNDPLVALTRWREIACVGIFINSFSCGLKHREIRSDNCKQPLPIIPFGIVAYAFTDKLSRNICTSLGPTALGYV